MDRRQYWFEDELILLVLMRVQEIPPGLGPGREGN